MTITEFLLARISEDEAREAGRYRHRDDLLPWGCTVTTGGFDPEYVKINHADGESVKIPVAEFRERYTEPAPDMRMLAECAAKRAIIEQHKDWPVLVEKKPEFTEDTDAIHGMTYRVAQEMVWLTEREYVKRFGVEAPTTNMILALAAIYKDHPDYDSDWAL